MTDQPVFGHRLPPAIVGTRYIKSKLLNDAPPVGFANIKDWNTFQAYNASVEARKNQTSDPQEVAKITDKRGLTRFGPYSRYNSEAVNDLGAFFGRKNYAVRHRPEWVSEDAASS
jgi:hypothetical protein